MSVLILEARDRVGGRTYTVESDGSLCARWTRPFLTAIGTSYEMGGTWVTHHMPHLFIEMVRYSMDRDLVITHQRGYDNDYFTMNVPGMYPTRLERRADQ